jgi:hypothetical protein
MPVFKKGNGGNTDNDKGENADENNCAMYLVSDIKMKKTFKALPIIHGL